jgi:hypothetical protein
MPVLTQIPRGAATFYVMAEIKPVEPDQGNACAGKEALTCFPLFVSQHFRYNFLLIKPVQK